MVKWFGAAWGPKRQFSALADLAAQYDRILRGAQTALQVFTNRLAVISRPIPAGHSSGASCVAQVDGGARWCCFLDDVWSPKLSSQFR